MKFLILIPVAVLLYISGCSSTGVIKTQAPSPTPTPQAIAPSPVQATTYDVTLQINTVDGDRTPEPGKLEVDGDIYKVSLGRQNEVAGYYEMVYEFNFAAKTFRQYCEQCFSPFPRDASKDKPLAVDSITAEGFAVTPQDMADELETKDFYILRLAGNGRPTVWPEASERAQTSPASSVLVDGVQVEIPSRPGFNAFVYDPPSNCRDRASKSARVTTVFEKGFINIDISSATDGWYKETYKGCYIHESQFKLIPRDRLPQ